MKDIKNTKEIVSLVSALVQAYISAKSDGKIDLNDIAFLIGILPRLNPAIDDIKEVTGELKDLDESETKEVVNAIKDIVGELADEKCIELAEEAIKIGIAAYEIVKILKREETPEPELIEG